MPEALLSITSEPLDLEAVVRLVQAGEPRGGHGAVATFLGIVRGESGGRRVLELDYEAHEPLALRVFGAIADEAGRAWPGVRVAIRQRVGRVPAGEASIAIAAAAPHRAEAFRACRYAIERVKQIAPVWKREVFGDGSSWVEGATADPSDEAARDAARRRACE